MTQKIWEQGYTQNRELSWLQFNARVLAEAEDENVPLLERFKFLAIFTSNLDEFFMIRVGSLCDMAAVDKEHTDSKSGLTAKEQLHLIYKAVEPLYARRDATFSDVDSKLSAIGLRRLTMDSLAPDEQKYITRYFKDIIAPVLSPQIVDSHHPFPHLEGKVLHIAALLSHKKTERLGLLPVPASLPPVVFLPETPSRYILTEDILLAYADHVFEMYDVLEKTVLCVTRNADIQVDDETFGVEGGDFRKKMEKLLRQRRRMAVVRVEISRPVSDHFKEHSAAALRSAMHRFSCLAQHRSSLGMHSRSANTCRKKSVRFSATRPSRRSSRPCCLPVRVCSRPLCSGIFCCPIRMRAWSRSCR